MLVLAAGVLAIGTPAGAGSALYGFVDERGVLHFTNVPSDRRFSRVRAPRSLATGSRADRFSPAPADPASPARIDRSSPARAKRLSLRSAYDGLIERASRRHGVPPALVKAVIHAESAFDPKAVSPKGAMGLMQLMPGTARLLGVAEPYHASENVEGGTRYLRSLHDRYGSWTHTLAAYNAGPSAVDHYRGVPPYTETRQYVKRVLSYYRRYHGDFAQ
jgi:soluble lytic murein transglycosylase-like protein